MAISSMEKLSTIPNKERSYKYLPVFKSISKDIENKSRNYHKKIEASLKNKN